MKLDHHLFVILLQYYFYFRIQKLYEFKTVTHNFFFSFFFFLHFHVCCCLTFLHCWVWLFHFFKLPCITSGRWVSRFNFVLQAAEGEKSFTVVTALIFTRVGAHICRTWEHSSEHVVVGSDRKSLERANCSAASCVQGSPVRNMAAVSASLKTKCYDLCKRNKKTEYCTAG